MSIDRFNIREFWDILSRQMKPRFHEISAYLIAFSLYWLFVFHSEIRQSFFIIFSGFGTMSPFFIILGLIVIAGLLISLFHGFTHRKKSPFEKAIMGWFVMGTSGVASFFVGTEMLPSRWSIMMILPIWNILNSALMLFQMGFQKYDVSDEDASTMEVFAATVVLVVILIISSLILHLSWAMTLSICIFYSTIIPWLANYFDLQLPAFMK